MSNFCCKEMYEAITEDKLVEYVAMDRSFSISVDEHVDSILKFCPWCGSTLPPRLHKEWYNVLYNEYNYDGSNKYDNSDMPYEMKTDEWWKKRGYDQPYVNNNTPEAIKIKVALPKIKNPGVSLYHSIHFGDPLNEGDPYKRVSVDEDSHFVVFVHEEITKDGEMVFTGYVAGWDEYEILGKKIEGLTPIMKEALYKEGLVLDMEGTINPEFIKKLKNDAALRNKTENN